MAIRWTQIRIRPSNDIPWHDPTLEDSWQEAYETAKDQGKIVYESFALHPDEVSFSDDGLTMITVAEFPNLDDFLRSQKDVIPKELRTAQRSYRTSNGITATNVIIDTETNIELSREQVIAREREMRASGDLDDNYWYFEPRS